MPGQINIASHGHGISAKSHTQCVRAGKSQHYVNSSLFLQIVKLLDDTPIAQDILINIKPKLSEALKTKHQI